MGNYTSTRGRHGQWAMAGDTLNTEREQPINNVKNAIFLLSSHAKQPL